MNNSRGFTLLELLMAAALTTILTIGLLAVLTNISASSNLPLNSIGNSSGVMSKMDISIGEIDALVRLLREDIIHADKIDASKVNELSITGYGALDRISRQRKHRPVNVLYKLEKIDGHFWLIRRQEALDVLSNQNIQRDLICSGVTRFKLVLIDSVLESIEKGGVDSSDVKNQNDNNVEQNKTETADNLLPFAEQKTSVLINGLRFYPEYVPDWASEYLPESNTVLTDISDKREVKESEEEGLKIDYTDVNYTDVNQIVWQLLFWTDDREEPDYDRIVAIQ